VCAFLQRADLRVVVDVHDAEPLAVAPRPFEVVQQGPDVAGRDPHNKDLADLVGELATRSDAFRARWAAHDVRLHRSGVKRFHHPAVGTVELSFEALDLPADPGLTLTAYTAEPGSPSEDALRLLASWAATAEPSSVQEL
jgi:hypothetical protein